MNPTSFSLDTAVENLGAAFGSIQALVIAISYVIGVALIVRGLMMYKVFGSQTMSSAQRGEFAGPLVFIVVGAILIYFPSTQDTLMTTVFGNSELAKAADLVNYQSLAGSEKWEQLSEVIIDYMYLVGLIAFVRGWVILSKMGHSGSQPGSMGKGLIHVIGGILLINIVDTVNLLAQTFGYVGT